MMGIVLVLALPIGVAASIYLEEFAPKNKWTDLIEVNINNLAAVPSIVFGLLGLAVFINFAGLPRSASIVGGLVLTLMTLPTIIIATRSALKAVPPSIREAALGVGASKTQTIFHHVLPLASPGILTGTIIGLAQALGETAPLLMIGMVAFVKDIPVSPFEPATALPVQIYMWAGAAERAFVERTSAAILILLAFLAIMNISAVLLRRRLNAAGKSSWQETFDVLEKGLDHARYDTDQNSRSYPAPRHQNVWQRGYRSLWRQAGSVWRGSGNRRKPGDLSDWSVRLW